MHAVVVVVVVAVVCVLCACVCMSCVHVCVCVCVWCVCVCVRRGRGGYACCAASELMSNPDTNVASPISTGLKRLVPGNVKVGSEGN
jgi:hypothetical protein